MCVDHGHLWRVLHKDTNATMNPGCHDVFLGSYEEPEQSWRNSRVGWMPWKYGHQNDCYGRDSCYSQIMVLHACFLFSSAWHGRPQRMSWTGRLCCSARSSHPKPLFFCQMRTIVGGLCAFSIRVDYRSWEMIWMNMLFSTPFISYYRGKWHGNIQVPWWVMCRTSPLREILYYS